MSARDRLLAYLQQAGLSTPRAEANLDAFTHELAEKQRAHIPYGSKGHAAQVSWHRHMLYGMAGETFEAQKELDAFEQGITKELTDLIDPSAGPARPDEEPTT